jgi:hypothetical protein
MWTAIFFFYWFTLIQQFDERDRPFKAQIGRLLAAAAQAVASDINSYG